MTDEGPDCRYCPYIECCSNQCNLAPERDHAAQYSSLDDVVEGKRGMAKQDWRYHLVDKGGNIVLFSLYAGTLFACGYYGITRSDAIQKDPSKGLFFYETLGGMFLGGVFVCSYLACKFDDLKKSLWRK